MEARSKQFCNRCNTAGLEQNICFCIATFQLDRLGDKHDSSEKCRINYTSDTHMTETTHVYFRTNDVHTTAIAFTSLPNMLPNPMGEKYSLAKTRSLRLVAWKITGKPWK